MIVLFVSSIVLVYLCAHQFPKFALIIRLLDTPDHRSAHLVATPTGAGITFIFVFGLVSLISDRVGGSHDAQSWLLECLVPITLVALVGFVDDFRPLSWKVRAPLQFGCSVWLVSIVGFPPLQVLGFSIEPSIIGAAFGVVALLWLLNLYNFMDGIDGIAIAEAVFVLTAAAGLACLSGETISGIVLVLLGCCIGFLVINWPTAKVFMGDAGSCFLGLTFGVLILSETMIGLWSWLVLLGWFITDACLTITIRLCRGDKIYEAHNLHCYQHLNRAIGTQNTLFVVLAVNAFWLLPIAFIIVRNNDLGAGLLLLAYMPLLAFQFLAGAGQAMPRIKAIHSGNNT